MRTLCPRSSRRISISPRPSRARKTHSRRPAEEALPPAPRGSPRRSGSDKAAKATTEGRASRSRGSICWHRGRWRARRSRGPAIKGPQAPVNVVCDEVREKPSQIGNFEVASRSSPVPRYPDHRRKFLDRVQRLLVCQEEFPYTLLGLRSRLRIGCRDLGIRVILDCRSTRNYSTRKRRTIWAWRKNCYVVGESCML